MARAPRVAYQQLRIAVDEGHPGLGVELIEGLLEAAGALAVSACEPPPAAGPVAPVLEPLPGEAPRWARYDLLALFPQDQDLTGLRRELAALGVAAQRESIAEQEWEKVGRATQPVHCGGRLWICPQGTSLPPGTRDAVVVSLDAGLAFGSGAHPTTRQCLAVLAELANDRSFDLAGARVLDMGCGSGVLAVAALRLGASSAWALDIDPQAITATQHNGARNGVADRLHTLLIDAGTTGLASQTDRLLAAAGGTFDLVLANILYGPLLALCGELARVTRGGGHLVLSGLLSHQAASVREAYGAWFAMPPARVSGDWACLWGERLPNEVASD